MIVVLPGKGYVTCPFYDLLQTLENGAETLAEIKRQRNKLHEKYFKGFASVETLACGVAALAARAQAAVFHRCEVADADCAGTDGASPVASNWMLGPDIANVLPHVAPQGAARVKRAAAPAAEA